jgi:hypothetical protein
MANPQTDQKRKRTMAESKVTVPQDDEFVTVSDGAAEPETKVVFEVLGDSFTGDDYLGLRTVPSPEGSYQQARFKNGDETFFVNANHSLREGLRTVRQHSRVRITWVDELDTGQAQPMRVFKVEVARRNASRST